MAKRNRVAKVKKREQAREHLQEAQVRAARADKEQALAEEQAARARRERAEAEERTRIAAEEGRPAAAHAGEEAQQAEALRARAQKLAPDLTVDGHPHQAPGTASPDQPGGGGATRR